MSTHTVCTIGHSNRSIDDFIGLLRQNAVECVVDIRTVPKSRFNPQFGQDQLPQALRAAGIAYRALPGLGGLRHPRPGSPNGGWGDEGFRGFADYMATSQFESNLETVIGLAQGTRCALMCAEALPCNCHRALVADALLVRGVAVEDIVDKQKRRPHALTPFARVEGTRISYPPQGGEQLGLF